MSIHPLRQGGVTSYEAVFTRLAKFRRLKEENRWKACCPVHEDNNPSLSLSLGRGGQLLARCHGCGASFSAIVQAVGLPTAAWFPDNGERWKPMPRKIVATFDFVDEHGEVLYQEVRFDPKDFKQRRPDGNGGWVWNLDGCRRILYRLPELLEADPARMVLVPEGPRKAEALARLGFVTTSNVGGARKWLPEFSRVLAGRHVALLPDNDTAGREHVEIVAGSLMNAGAQSIRIVWLPVEKPKGDVIDWLAAGGTARELKRLIAATEAWTRAGRKAG